MTNRLGALRKQTQGVTGERPVAVAVPADDPFKSFWDEYNRIDAEVQEIDDTLEEITRLDEEIQSTQDAREAADKRGELHAKLDSITSSATVIKGNISKLKDQVEDNAAENPCSADVRLQNNHLHVLSNKFATVINRFTTLQDEIKAKFAKQVTRHYNIAGIHIDEDQAEQIISQNPDALQQSVFTLQGNSAQMQEVVNTYNTIAARHDDILAIERSMRDLMELFVQFSIIVKDQGRQIDNIEANIAQAKSYVETGVKNLETAAKHQKSSRKCLYWILGIALIILIVVILIVVFSSK